MKEGGGYLSPLPDKGWGVLRCPTEVAIALHLAGLVKVQMTATKGVFHARLTGAGRRYRAASADKLRTKREAVPSEDH
jgi:hypothetical protein